MNKYVFTFTLALATAFSQAQVFQAVPRRLGASTNEVSSISGDGLTIVGIDADGFAARTVLWRVGESTVTIIEPIPALAVTRDAFASRDGTVVAGVMNSSIGEGNTFLWTAATGTQQVSNFYVPNAISGDGSTIVGFNDVGTGLAVRWTAAGGVQDFGTLQGVPLPGFGRTNRMFEANAARFDGAVIAGSARVQVDTQTPLPTIEILPWRWDAVNGARLLTNADGSMYLGGASASDMSSDGSWIVGEGPGLQFFRWREDLGFQFITRITDGIIGDRPRVSDDGGTIVWGRNFWTESSGVQTLQSVLTQAGCDFTGWTNLSAVDVSADGLTIAGNGTNPLGQAQGWVATVPSPGGVVVVGVVGLAAMRRRRRRLKSCHAALRP